jgi:hypothetical protein
MNRHDAKNAKTTKSNDNQFELVVELGAELPVHLFVEVIG